MLKSLTTTAHLFFNYPKHIRAYALADSLSGCLRRLEQKAGLPKGDLTVEENPRKVVSLLGHRGNEHIIISQTSAKWKADETKQGYIAGHLFEPTGNATLTPKEWSNLSLLAAGLVGVSNTIKYMGKVHISKNCPGVYSEDGVCTTCGDIGR